VSVCLKRRLYFLSLFTELPAPPSTGPPNRADHIPVVKATREPYLCLVIVNTVHKLRGGAERVDAGKGSRRGNAGRRELGDLRRGMWSEG
jgi:hypothetical protein